MKRLMMLFFCLWACMANLEVQAEEGNAILVTDNGLEMFHWDLDFIRAAQESIEISAPFMGGEIARKLLTTLETRLEQIPKLKVYLLTTPTLLENEDWVIIERLHKRFADRFYLEHASTVVIVWPTVTGIDNHVKICIVDEKYFSAGGTNLDETQCSEGTWTPHKNLNKVSYLSNNLPAGMRDQDIVGRGPLAIDLRRCFFHMYAMWENYNKTGVLIKDPQQFQEKTYYCPVSSQAHVARFDSCPNLCTLKSEQIKILMGGPHQNQNEISEEYVRLIQQASEEIVISNLYFSPVDSIFNALLDAVNRGVKLTVVTNGVGDIAPLYTQCFCWANRMSYVPVFYGSAFHFWDAWSMTSKPLKNTRIYEYHVKDVLLHKKVMIVDGKISLVGSYNLGLRSDMGDYEMVIRMDSPEIAADLMRVHKKDLRHSTEIFPEEACSWYFDPVKASIGEMQKRVHGLI